MFVPRKRNLNNRQMSIINVNKVVSMMSGGNSYTYTKVSNLLSGSRGRASKKEIKQVRSIIKEQLNAIDKQLAAFENE